MICEKCGKRYETYVPMDDEPSVCGPCCRTSSPTPSVGPACGELLKLRHTAMLEWVEPWPACGPQGNTLDAHITLRATVHDCINLQRGAEKHAGHPAVGDDAHLLEEFMAVHWARARNEQA